MLSSSEFSLQNTTPVSLIFGQFAIPQIPIYVIILGSLLIGVLIAWLFNLIDALSAFLILRKKESTIRELKKTTSELIRRVHHLELDTDKKKSGGNPQTGGKTKEEEIEDENSF